MEHIEETMKLAKKLIAKVQRNRSINQTFRQINNIPDRELRDIGLNPELVRVGKRAYPWR